MKLMDWKSRCVSPHKIRRVILEDDKSAIAVSEPGRQAASEPVSQLVSRRPGIISTESFITVFVGVASERARETRAADCDRGISF